MLRTVDDSDPAMPQFNQVLGGHLSARYVVYVHKGSAVRSPAKEPNAWKFLAHQLADNRIVFVPQYEHAVYPSVGESLRLSIAIDVLCVEHQVVPEFDCGGGDAPHHLGGKARPGCKKVASLEDDGEGLGPLSNKHPRQGVRLIP